MGNAGTVFPLVKCIGHLGVDCDRFLYFGSAGINEQSGSQPAIYDGLGAVSAFWGSLYLLIQLSISAILEFCRK